MSWIGLLLLGVAATDLARSVVSVRPLSWVPGVVVVVALTVLTGVRGASALVSLLAGVVVVVLWDRAVHRADATERPRGAASALVVLGAALALAVVAAPWSPRAGGPWAAWLAESPWPTLATADPGRALLVLGVVAAQLSTGNVVVRLVLRVTDTVGPASGDGRDGPADPSRQLRGGRMLGPMERLVIVGLGLAGQLTAASIVIAAKGLLRWPELQSGRSAGDATGGETAWDVHRVTEYFLVGSFVSWLVALGGLVLAR